MLGDNLHEMSKLTFWENINNLSSTELAQKVKDNLFFMLYETFVLCFYSFYLKQSNSAILKSI